MVPPPPPQQQTTTLDSEAAKKLAKIPKEFKNATFLINSEVFQLHEERRQKMEGTMEIDDSSDSLKKSREYLQRLDHYRTPESISAAKAIFAGTSLTEMEIAQLINLGPDNAEEAKDLVISITDKIDDVELDELLRNLKTRKGMQ